MREITRKLENSMYVVLLVGDLGRTWSEGRRRDPRNGYRVHTGPAATVPTRPSDTTEPTYIPDRPTVHACSEK